MVSSWSWGWAAVCQQVQEGTGDVKGGDELREQGPYWPFLKYQATDLFQGLWGNELLKAADMCTLMEHCTIRQGPEAQPS